MIAFTTKIDNDICCDSSTYDLLKVILKLLHLLSKLFVFFRGFRQFGNNQRQITGGRTSRFTEGGRACWTGERCSHGYCSGSYPPLHSLLWIHAVSIVYFEFLGARVDEAFLLQKPMLTNTHFSMLGFWFVALQFDSLCIHLSFLCLPSTFFCFLQICSRRESVLKSCAALPWSPSSHFQRSSLDIIS
jgi:hypothetical protein